MSAEDLELAVRALIDRSSGLAGTDFKKELGKAWKGWERQALDVAGELAAKRQIHRWSSPRKVRFFREDPVATLSRVVSELLATGPLSEADLKKRVEAVGRGLGDVLKEWLKAAQARGEIHLQAPVRGSKVKRFSLEPDVGLLLKKVLLELRKAMASPLGSRVDRTRVLEALATELGVAPSAVARSVSSIPASAATVDRDVVLRAVADLAAEHESQGLLLIRELRARAALAKDQFDRVVLALASDGVVTLHHHDFPESLSAGERAELVSDPQGTHYVGIAYRRNR